jgi:hypothetical protein
VAIAAPETTFTIAVAFDNHAKKRQKLIAKVVNALERNIVIWNIQCSAMLYNDPKSSTSSGPPYYVDLHVNAGKVPTKTRK